MNELQGTILKHDTNDDSFVSVGAAEESNHKDGGLREKGDPAIQIGRQDRLDWILHTLVG